jgi:hypothetical protein
MFNRRTFIACAAVLGAAVLGVTSGCDWLQSSDPGSRQSPFLSSVRVTPGSVLCGTPFELSFRYDDPQGDVASVLVTMQHGSDEPKREESPAWPATGNTTNGTVAFSFSFPCTAVGGDWTVTVQVTDARGNTSNILQTSVRLGSAG